MVRSQAVYEYLSFDDLARTNNDNHENNNVIEFESQTGSLLWCMKTFRHGRDPHTLPNDRCCPYINFDEDATGVPYSSTVTGCCNNQLYDLTTQICCHETG